MATADRRAGLGSEREALDDDARYAHHEGLLSRALALCWESPFHRERLEAAGFEPGDVVGLEDLQRLPITTKQQAREAMAGLGSFPLTEAKRIFVSPGPHFYASQRRADLPPARGETPLALAFHAMGFREDDIVLNTFAYHLSPGGFGLEEQLIAAGCAVIPAGPQNIELQVQIMSSLPVTGFVGTPTFLKLLCDKAADLDVDPREDWALEIAFVGGEKLIENVRADLEERTGAMIRQVYGSADGLLPAYECWAATGMHLHPDQILEVLDVNTHAPVPVGEPGEVVATVPNPNRPLLRFGNGDLVELRDDPCPCGRTGLRIARVVGRVDEATKVRGMFIYPEQISEVLARHPHVRRWRAVVERDAAAIDVLTVEVELEEPSSEATVGTLERELRGVIRVRPVVEVVPADSIPDDAKRIDDRRSDG